VPFGVSIIEAAQAGQRSMDHAYRIVWDCYPGAATLLQRAARDIRIRGAAGGAGYVTTAERYEMIREHSAAQCDAVFRAMVQHKMWYVPTHVTRRFEAMAGDSSFMNDPRLKYTPKTRLREWLEDANEIVAIDPSPAGRKAFRDFYTLGLSLTKRAHEAGVRILAGSDLPDSYVFPGFGLLDELEELAIAGLPPADILKAATINPAEFTGQRDSHGSIEAGKLADIVLLLGDPLQDIRHTRRIAGVVLNGRFLDRAALDGLLKAAELAVRRADSGASDHK
jgi:hypothetical protein